MRKPPLMENVVLVVHLILALCLRLLAIGFICTSIGLTIIAADQSAGASVVDRIVDAPAQGSATPDLGDSLLPPSSDDAPLVPSGE